MAARPDSADVDTLKSRMKDGKLLIAVIHLPALPGSPRATSFDRGRFLERVRDEAKRLSEVGFHALVIENFGDIPFFATSVEPHTIAMMTAAVIEARDVFRGPIGVNVLRNDAMAALGIASATGCAFLRVNVHTGVSVTDQGLIEGTAAETLRYRQTLGIPTLIFADVDVKHAQPLAQQDLSFLTEETLGRGLADGAIVSGPTTGRPPEFDAIKAVRRAAGSKPVLLGSGFQPHDPEPWLDLVDGVIVSSCLRRGGRAGAPLDARRLERFNRDVVPRC